MILLSNLWLSWLWLLAANKNHSHHHHRRPSSSSSSSPTLASLLSDTSSSSPTNTILLIDVENVRGKSGFALSHAQFLQALETWMLMQQQQQQHQSIVSLNGRVLLLIDHGDDATAHYHHHNNNNNNKDGANYAVQFSGPLWKADDVLVEQVIPYFCQQQEQQANNRGMDNIVVVTADGPLISKCQRAVMMNSRAMILAEDDSSSGDRVVPPPPPPRLHILSPSALLQEWETILEPPPVLVFDKKEEEENNNNNDVTTPLPIHYDAATIQAACDCLQAQLALRVQGHDRVRTKHRKVLLQRIQQWRQSIPTELLNGIQRIVEQGATLETLQGFDSTLQQHLYDAWRLSSSNSNSKRRRAYKMETTQMRIVLAEQLRRAWIDKEQEEKRSSQENEAGVGVLDESLTTTVINSNPAWEYVQYCRKQQQTRVNGRVWPATTVVKGDSQNSQQHTTLLAADGSLRLVIVSDTHGMEEQLNHNSVVPAGDVLLHLGDFGMDTSKGAPKDYSYYEKFDQWLADQPHSLKIVLRGNHDPRKFEFTKSQAKYVTRACNMDIGGYDFALVPYMGGGLTNRCLPKTCNIMVSHVPPRGFLDRSCLNGQLAGSQTLRRGMERMKGGPPSLLLCGHIHEGRGALRTVFCGNHDTLIVNAANANAGVAKHIEYDPVVLDIRPGITKRHPFVSIVEMAGRYEYLRDFADDASFFTQPTKSDVSYLLAVDLGLRTGVSIFDSSGKLLSFEDFLFASTEDLLQGAVSLIARWEERLNTKITHIAIEGSDIMLWKAWMEAATSERHLLSVKPSDWRNDLLLPKEQSNGLTAKAASRLIARQIVADHGVMPVPETEFQTDAAESILLGLHVARRLNWIVGEPAIRRSLTGTVLLTAQTEMEKVALVAA